MTAAPMTLDQFLAELRKVTESEGIEWGLISFMGHPDLIRAESYRDRCGCPCPWLVVGVVTDLTHDDFPDSWRVTNAADNVTGRDPALRARLLKACGLTEAA